jgi:hypothetical protein
MTKKSKTAVAAGIGVVVAIGIAISVMPRQHLPTPQPVVVGQTEFPRASWAYAGSGDPQSALLSYCWASVRPDEKAYEATVTPAEKLNYEQAIDSRMKIPPGKSRKAVVQEMATQNSARVLGFRIVEQKAVSENQAIIHVQVQTGEQNAEPYSDLYAKMQKMGNQWKYGGWSRPPGAVN